MFVKIVTSKFETWHRSKLETKSPSQRPFVTTAPEFNFDMGLT